MRKELLQELQNRGLASLNKQTVERFFWMKSVICLPTPRRKYFALFRRMRLFAWEAMNRSLSMYVISATNKDLQAEIEEGNFREDLFHRLNVIPVHLPPLRERREDIALLTNSFLEKLSEKEIFYSGKFFSEEAIEALKNQDWPGNIRGLQNAIERLLLLSPEDEITAGDVEQFVTRKRSSRKQLERLVDEIESFHVFKEESEKLFLIKKLEKYDWNISATADAIQIQRSHMYNKIKKYDMEKGDS